MANSVNETMKKDVQKKKRKSLGTILKEFKSDLKKITWPTFKKVLKNTGLVLVSMIIISAVISLVDLGLNELLKLFVTV